MPEVKTIECFSKFSVSGCVDGSHKAILESSCPELEDSDQVLVFLKTSLEEDINSVKKCLYQDCNEGELVIGVKGSEIFSFSVEDGELKVICPENYDFQLSEGELIISKKPEGLSKEGIGYWRVGYDFVVW